MLRSKSTFIVKVSPLVMFALFRVMLEFDVCDRLIVNGRVEISVMFLSEVLSAGAKALVLLVPLQKNRLKDIAPR